MAVSWNSAHSLLAALPWARAVKLIGGTYVTRELRLVRPLADAGGQSWVADHFGHQLQVAVTFASSCVEPRGPSGVARVRVAEGARDVVSGEAEAFARQARVSAHLADPHLVQVLEQGNVKDVPYIVTELLEGRSLRQRVIQDGPLSLPEARALVDQIGAVLARAHALSCCHGDVRPEHLHLVDTAGGPFFKISGLGGGGTKLAAASASMSLLEQAYVSPERLLSGAAGDPASDLWALSVALYELLTTTLPFEAPTPAGIAVAICNAQFSPPSHYRADLPSSVDDWFARALAKEPQERFKDALELAHSFGRALDAAEANASADVGSWSEPVPDLSGDEDDEEEERTVKWDLPSEWNVAAHAGLAGEVGASTGLPSPSPSLPPPLPDRAPSSRPPPADARPGAVFSADLTRLARLPPPPGNVTAPASSAVSATAAASRAAAPGPAGLQRIAGLPRLTMPNPVKRLGLAGQALLFGATLGAASALALWIVQGFSSNDEEESAALQTGELEGTASAVRGLQREPHPSELPRIIHTDDLPRAPEDDFEEDGDVEAPAPSSQRAIASAERASQPSSPQAATTANAAARTSVPAAQKAAAASSDPAEGKASVAFASGRSAAAAPRVSAATRGGSTNARASAPARAPAVKQAKAAASCNPPYYFDSNNIRRLKLECL